MKRVTILFALIALFCSQVINAQLRRPISPEQPMWIIHVDTWNTADPERIIEMVPEDIRPYVVFNLSLSATDAVCCNGPDVCDAWMRACAAKRVWAMIQPASGSHSRFSDTEFSEYERYFKQYPNFIGWNFAEQFWGFGDTGQPTFEQRLNTFAHILDYCQEYGGYLVVSFTQAYFSAHMMPIAYMRNAALRKRLTAHPENFICCEKYTMANDFYDIESNCLGAYLGGYAGQLGIRFDACGWTASDGNKDPFVKATSTTCIMEHVMLNGMTVIDGPETIPVECSREVSTSTVGGYTRRNWDWFPHFVNCNIDEFRKLLDGTVRIQSREEVIKRTKVAIINNGGTHVEANGPIDVHTPEALYDGLYRFDCDNWGRGTNPHKRPLEQRWWMKRTGRYPAPAQCYSLVDSLAKTMQVQVKYANYQSRWGNVDKKVAEFNTLFPEEYTGDIFAAHVDNTWMTYNPYQYDDVLDESTNTRTITTSTQRASGVIPFLYNTCDSVRLDYAPYSMGVMKETVDGVSFYLSNYRNSKSGSSFTEKPNVTDTIRIYGISEEPTVEWKDRGKHRKSTVAQTFADGVLTLTVKHNGPLDVYISCQGKATDRLSCDGLPVANVTAPALPPLYTDTLEYEAECMDYKSITANRPNGYYHGHARYMGQGFVEFGTNSAASLRDTISVPSAGQAKMRLRYQAPNGDAAVRIKIGTTTQTVALSSCDTWKEVEFSADLAEGRNVVTILAATSNRKNLFLDCLKIYDYQTETTAIRSIDNGQCSMINGQWFDLQGRKVSNPTQEGIYIKNGKKVFVK
jgi:hypothetical protein